MYGGMDTLHGLAMSSQTVVLVCCHDSWCIMLDNNNCEYLVTLQDPFPLFPGESLEGGNAGGKLVKEKGLCRE